MAQFSIFGRQITIARAEGDGRDVGPIRQASPESESAAPNPNLITRSLDAFGASRWWLEQIAQNDDPVLRKAGYVDTKVYDQLLDDDIAFSAFQQRRLALVSRPWEVEPGDKSPQAKEAADHLRQQLSEIGWDRICDLMMYGRWYGYAVAEVLWKLGKDGKVWLDEIIVPDRRWFAFTNEGELRMRTVENPQGLVVPDNKFWSIRTGATNDFVPYGMGLAHWCYWLIWFKRNVTQFWMIYLEKFGMPTIVATVPPGSNEQVTAAYLAAAKAVGKDSAVAIPGDGDGKTEVLKPIEAMRSSTGGSSYKDFISSMDDALLRIIIGQTMTAKAAAGGIGSNQSDTHKEVRDELVKSDSDMLHESFNRTVAKWLTAWNFGPDVAPPRVYRCMDDEEDLTAVADRDATLDSIGIKRTDESIREVYGEGYERVEVQPQPVVVKPGQKLLTGPGGKQFDVHDPAPLYIRRDLLNAKALVKWAKDQGFKTVVDPESMHCTILYSKTPVDWFNLPEDYWSEQDGKLTVAAGGPRKVEALGEEGAVVLHFTSRTLRYRHNDLVEAGGSHDYAEYLTHVTLSYDAGDIDLEAIEPYTGPLIFGPEIFEEIKGSFDPGTLDLVEFSAEDIDAIDTLTAQLLEDSNPVFSAMATELQASLKGVKTPEALRIALLQSFERLPIEKLAELGALKFTATRATAEAGVA